MDDKLLEHAERISKLEESNKQAHKKINEVIETQKILHEMNINIALIAEENKHQNENIRQLKDEVKQNMSDFKTEMKDDINGVKNEMGCIKSDIGKMDETINEIKNKPSINLQDNVKKIKDKVLDIIIGAIGVAGIGIAVMLIQMYLGN